VQGISPVIDWYRNKAYQCPRCRHDTVASPSTWEVYTCCNCGTRFARFPRLQRFLRHVGITCEWCTERHPVLVDGKPFGFLCRRHTGIGMYAEHQFEAWLYDTDEIPDHRDRVRYRNTRSSRAEAMADLAHWRSMFDPVEDDLSPVLAVVADEKFYKYGPDTTEEQRGGFLDGTLEVYGVGVLRPYAAPHRRRGQFCADADTFTWGLIAPFGLEGIYTRARHLPKALAGYAPQL
jgi:DNA-directed RNA polymerase subunit RPC12/RpoP